jgi:Fic family protein
MKIPKRPPSWDQLTDAISNQDLWEKVLSSVSKPGIDDGYLHWDKIRWLKPPFGLTHEAWWMAIKQGRLGGRRSIPLLDQNGRSFSFCRPFEIESIIHRVDLQAGGSIKLPSETVTNESRDHYVIQTLMEEAIRSSQLEGAATTREVAREMIRNNRKPTNLDERMIQNNYATMQRVRAIQDQPLSPDLVFEIHRIVTEGTLQNPDAAGRLRKDAERVEITDVHEKVLFEPPPADQLAQRLEAMCRFANDDDTKQFLHPVIRSIFLHFWLAYDHPFVDGNGRTARALFYWSMLHHGYWLCEYISISEIILRAPAKYGNAFLYSETDDNDLTYFLVYHLQVINQAIDEIYEYIDRKSKERNVLLRRIKGLKQFNDRQIVLLIHALSHPNQVYTVRSHRRSNGVTYDTARLDLLELAERGVLHSFKVGREWRFSPADNLEALLSTIEHRPKDSHSA